MEPGPPQLGQRWEVESATPPLPGSEYYGDVRLFDGTYPAAALNTSGLGPGHFLPPEAQGWTWAGAVPCGIFAFRHGQLMWGILPLLCVIPHLGIAFAAAYFFKMGSQGRQLAWQHRRFTSIAQFDRTMQVWNRAGLIMFVIDLALVAGLIVLWLVIGLQEG